MSKHKKSAAMNHYQAELFMKEAMSVGEENVCAKKLDDVLRWYPHLYLAATHSRDMKKSRNR